MYTLILLTLLTFGIHTYGHNVQTNNQVQLRHLLQSNNSNNNTPDKPILPIDLWDFYILDYLKPNDYSNIYYANKQSMKQKTNQFITSHHFYLKTKHTA